MRQPYVSIDRPGRPFRDGVIAPIWFDIASVNQIRPSGPEVIAIGCEPDGIPLVITVI